MKRESKITHDHEMHRETILKAAEIMAVEGGIDQISIRKLAARIEYSPTVIYHYFKNKDELIASIMSRGYGSLLEALYKLELPENPKDALRQLINKHFELILEIPEIYKSVQLSEIDELREKTAFLHQRASSENSMLGILTAQIARMFGSNADSDLVEQTAQVIAAATFGLEIRIITEKIGEPQRTLLIQHFTEIMCGGIEQLANNGG